MIYKQTAKKEWDSITCMYGLSFKKIRKMLYSSPSYYMFWVLWMDTI